VTAPRFRLLQARDPGEITRSEEIAAFADKLRVPVDHIVPHDMLSEPARLDVVRDGVDAVLVGGSGRYGIRDETPWMQGFVDLLGELAATQTPTFASCFGFQGLVMAMGGLVEAVPSSSEVGSFELQVTSDAADDPLFEGLPDRFWAQMGHKDSATSFPAEAVHLARSQRCTYQAMRVGTKVYATQFHPELSESDNRLRYERYYEEYSLVFGADKAHSILDSFRPSEPSSELLYRFRTHILG
jgi:GMP synthase (glutamine-hydrolysing)